VRRTHLLFCVPYASGERGGAIKKTNRAMLFRLFSPAFAMMNMMWIAMRSTARGSGRVFSGFFTGWGAAGNPDLLYSGYPFLSRARAACAPGPHHGLPIALGMLKRVRRPHA